ncbi:MAG: MlaE family ABC transporter permease [Succiniclasticum sp.]
MLQKLSAAVGRKMIEFSRAAGGMTLLCAEVFKRLRAVDGKETLRQMALLGADSLPIVLLTMLCVGMVFSVQTAKEFVILGASNTVGGIVAIAMGRELVPVLAGVVVAGRIGAAIAAELGTMKVTEQIDALRVMATSPVRYLVCPRFLAISLMMPVLIVFGNFIGNVGGYMVAHFYAGISSFTYINSIKTLCDSFDLVGGMIKGVVFGAIIAIVGCYKGLHARQGAEGVGLATTASVVLSIILIFITDYFMTVLLYVSD